MNEFYRIQARIRKYLNLQVNKPIMVNKHLQANRKSGLKSLKSLKCTDTSTEPLNKVNVTGETWLSRGKLLMLNVTCNGTGPFHYCVNITYGAYNESGTVKLDIEQYYNSTVY